MNNWGVFIVELIDTTGTTKVQVFFKRWEAREVFHYLAGFGHCVHIWEL